MVPHSYTLSPQAVRFVKQGDSCTAHVWTRKGVIKAPLPTRIVGVGEASALAEAAPRGNRSILAYTYQFFMLSKSITLPDRYAQHPAIVCPLKLCRF
jgi:hypothetical protein